MPSLGHETVSERVPHSRVTPRGCRRQPFAAANVGFSACTDLWPQRTARATANTKQRMAVQTLSRGRWVSRTSHETRSLVKIGKDREACICPATLGSVRHGSVRESPGRPRSEASLLNGKRGKNGHPEAPHAKAGITQGATRAGRRSCFLLFPFPESRATVLRSGQNHSKRRLRGAALSHPLTATIKAVVVGLSGPSSLKSPMLLLFGLGKEPYSDTSPIPPDLRMPLDQDRSG